MRDISRTEKEEINTLERPEREKKAREKKRRRKKRKRKKTSTIGQRLKRNIYK